LNAARHVDVERERVERITPPGQLAGGRTDVQIDQLGDGAVRAVLAGDPLG